MHMAARTVEAVDVGIGMAETIPKLAIDSVPRAMKEYRGSTRDTTMTRWEINYFVLPSFIQGYMYILAITFNRNKKTGRI